MPMHTTINHIEMQCARVVHLAKRVETSRGNLIERSKPRCVQFASINVSSLALWEHRHRTEMAKGKDDKCPDGEGKDREEEEEERDESGRRCNQSLGRGVTSCLSA